MTSAAGGQNLSPNPNVNAPAGRGGDVWGANGGGVTPYNAPTSTANAQATCQQQSNLLIGGTARQSPAQSILSQESKGALPASTANNSLPTGGSTAG